MTEVTQATEVTDISQATEVAQVEQPTAAEIGAAAARGAMKSRGRPAAIAWFQQNVPASAAECSIALPVEWWIGFDAELASVQGTA